MRGLLSAFQPARLPRATAVGMVPFRAWVRRASVVVLAPMLVGTTLLVASALAELAARPGFSHPQSALLMALFVFARSRDDGHR